VQGNGEKVQPLVDPSPRPRDTVEGEVVGEAEGAGEAEALVLGAGGAVADEDGAADDGGGGAAAGEDLGRLHAVDARWLGQPDRPHRPRVLRGGWIRAAGGEGRIRGEAGGLEWIGCDAGGVGVGGFCVWKL